MLNYYAIYSNKVDITLCKKKKKKLKAVPLQVINFHWPCSFCSLSTSDWTLLPLARASLVSVLRSETCKPVSHQKTIVDRWSVGFWSKSHYLHYVLDIN
jgi:hypothetical protein